MSDTTYATAAYESANPRTLVETPANFPDPVKPTKPWWETLYLHCESRMGALRSWRWTWWVHWARVAEYFLPRRFSWFIVANRMTRGSPINDQIIDSTGGEALLTCASGLWSGLTNPSRPWKKLGSALPWAEPDADGKKWLEDLDDKLDVVLSQSNFYEIMGQAFEDLVAFGNAPIIIYEDAQDVLRFYLPCAGEYYLGVGGTLRVDTFYREFTFNANEIIEFFGFENCPQAVQDAWVQGGGRLQNEWVVCHAIEPNFPLNARGKEGKTDELRVLPPVFTWREVYWLRGEVCEKPLSLRGFHVKPFFVLQWKKVSNDAYARSPCMENLGDQKQIQLQTLRLNEFIEKGVRPPMGAHPDLKNEPASINPAHITYMSTDTGKKGFWPLFEVQPQWVTAMVETIKGCAERIQRGLFVDVFNAISQREGVQPLNELELSMRDLERLQKLGPPITVTLGALSEGFHRMLDVLDRRRLIPPPPDSMKGVPVKVDYISIMRLAQQNSKAAGLKGFLATLGGLSSAAQAAGVPNPIRKFNLDDMSVQLSELAGVSSRFVYSDNEVAAHDAARAKVQQQAQQTAQLPAMVDAAHSLSQTQISGGNALGALLGAGGGGGGGQPPGQ